MLINKSDMSSQYLAYFTLRACIETQVVELVTQNTLVSLVYTLINMSMERLFSLNKLDQKFTFAMTFLSYSMIAIEVLLSINSKL